MSKYALVNGNIIDGTKDAQVVSDKVVLINDKKIEKIVDKNESIDGYQVIDVKGGYILPGLINMHVHLPANGKPKKKQADNKKLVKLITSNKLTNYLGVKICEGYAKQCLRAEECRTLPMWKGLYKVIEDYLQGISLASLAKINAADNYII